MWNFNINNILSSIFTQKCFTGYFDIYFRKKFYDYVTITVLADINCFRGVNFAPQFI